MGCLLVYTNHLGGNLVHKLQKSIEFDLVGELYIYIYISISKSAKQTDKSRKVALHQMTAHIISEGSQM